MRNRQIFLLKRELEILKTKIDIHDALIHENGKEKAMNEEEKGWVEKGETTRYFLFGVVVGTSVSAILIFSLLIFMGVL